MNLENILYNIQKKATAPKVKLVAVSKLQPVEKIRKLAAQGQKIFAENYAQEALPKMQTLKALDLEWHFVGRLQKNKVKQIVGAFSLVHSVDSLELVEKINQVAEEKGLTQKILLQLNLSGELSKGGLSRSEFEKSIPALQEFKNVQIVGLMTMPPLFDDVEKTRPYFHELKELQKKHSSTISDLQELSMGTSADFEIALSEGSTLVRLGTLIFGERQNQNE